MDDVVVLLTDTEIESLLKYKREHAPNQYTLLELFDIMHKLDVDETKTADGNAASDKYKAQKAAAMLRVWVISGKIENNVPKLICPRCASKYVATVEYGYLPGMQAKYSNEDAPLHYNNGDVVYDCCRHKCLSCAFGFEPCAGETLFSPASCDEQR